MIYKNMPRHSFWAWEEKSCHKKGQMWNTELENLVTAHFCNWKSGTPFLGRRAYIFETFALVCSFCQPGWLLCLILMKLLWIISLTVKFANATVDIQMNGIANVTLWLSCCFDQYSQFRFSFVKIFKQCSRDVRWACVRAYSLVEQFALSTICTDLIYEK